MRLEAGASREPAQPRLLRRDVNGRRRRITNEMTRVLVVVLLLLLLAPTACGGNSSGSSASTKLSITIWPQGKSGRSVTYTLACPQGTGTLPAAHSACSKLRRRSIKAFAPVPAGTACTELYGGPQTARVTGHFAGKSIKANFNRTNGCEIARWSRLAFLFQIRMYSSRDVS
jgi:hypothetical protein